MGDMTTFLMIQGTGSHVGKSIIAAGFCRLLSNMGVSVAPFKSQNMSLNSCVTADGAEIARAQELQARAARVEPRSVMNPVLLKPKRDGRCEVIVLGGSIGDFTAREYFRGAREPALGAIRRSLAELGTNHDTVVIEGAGSPAEINLRRFDLCNMKVAKMSGAAVLLVADIDRGGALASVVGTLDLLRPDERALVKGVIFNKFRGDLSLLEPGLKIVEKKTGVKVVGVVPYLDCSHLDEEDSHEDLRGSEGPVAVVKLPYMSNFTDFAPLESAIPVRWVSGPGGLDGVRAVVIPGSRNAVGDLVWMKETGLAAEVRAAAVRGAAIVGICGGYQMLGERLVDPSGSEGAGAGEHEGLGLLPVTTTYRPGKTTRTVTAEVVADTPVFPGLAGRSVRGYEIHCGEADPGGVRELFVFDRGGERVPDGAVSESGLVVGTHLHGLFNNPEVIGAFASFLGVDAPRVDFDSLAEESLDALAAALERSLDIDHVLDLIGVAR